MRILARHLLLTLMFALTAARAAPASDANTERRIDGLIQQMTVEEKIDLLGGINGFDIRGVPRLKVPAFATADGPFGIRRASRANIMMGGIGLAATWNPELARRVGQELGRDARARGVHFHLAPGVNIYRSPLNGRNFEYMGEDPMLASRMVVPLIEGVQSNGVAATAKHYLGNNSEFLRHTTDSVIDERTLREIYTPAFEAAVKQAHVAAVMTSYNLVNGEHMSQNRRLNVDLLKGEWGFDGLVMSDWDATYDTLGAANGGLDLEMPSGKFMNRERLMPLVKSGQVSQATVDDKVRRLLRTAVRFGWLEREQLDGSIPRYNAQGREVALQTAREGIVLLKNTGGVLPLDKGKLKSIAVIGPNGYPSVPHGGGSVTLAPFRAISLLEGVSDTVQSSAEVLWARGIPELRTVAQQTQFQTASSGGPEGVNVQIFANSDLSGSPESTRIDPNIQQGAPLDLVPLALGTVDRSVFAPMKPVSIRWTGYYTPQNAGLHDVFMQFGSFARGVGHRLYVDDRLVSDRWNMKHAAVEQLAIELDARPHKIVLEYRGEVGGIVGKEAFAQLGIVREGSWVDSTAEQLARKADAVVLAVGFDATSELEDWDRTFALPPGQNELIKRILAVNDNAILVINSGGAVDMREWVDDVPAVLQAWYPGQEGGVALAEILFGTVNPSGKLPATFERRPEDNPAYAHYYPQPGTNRVLYKEGVFVGYRGYEKHGTQPLFPFGHGLSYTTFKYDDLKIAQRAGATLTSTEGAFDVSFTVTNTGPRAGATVAQVYVADDHAPVPRPPKELKGFAKVLLGPGESRSVAVPLDARAFAYYEVQSKQWRARAGAFRVLVGSSSAQIELAGEARLEQALAF